MKKIKLSWLIGLVLILPQLLIIASQIIFYQMSSSFIESSLSNSERFQIHFRTQELLSFLKDAENNQRGYLLTAKESYLTPYKEALKKVDDSYELFLAQGSKDNYIKSYAPSIGQLIEEKKAVMNQAIASKRALGSSVALRIDEVERGQKVMELLRQKMSEINRIQEGELINQTGTTSTHIVNFRKVMMYASFIHLIFSGLIIWLIYRMNRIENMVTVCAWSKTINYEGEWMSFEDYLTKRFNLSITHGMSEKVFEQFEKTHQAEIKSQSEKPEETEKPDKKEKKKLAS